MKRKFGKLAVVTGLLLCLSGCFFRSVDELYVLPTPSPAYADLQTKLKEIKAEPIAPLGGNNTQPVQLVDLDGDGVQEAVAFFRDSAAERPLKIYVFRQTQDGEYTRYNVIEGAASDIDSIEYQDLGGDQQLEVVVSWQVSSAVHTLVVYQVEDSQVAEMMRSGYTNYLLSDLNQDGKEELLLLQFDRSSPSVGRVELYLNREGVLELDSVAPSSEGVQMMSDWRAGTLTGGQPAVYLTFEYQENSHITDIFCIGEKGLHNVTLQEGKRQSTETIRHFTGLTPMDINGDGVTELPMTQSIPSYKNGSDATVENFWKVLWWQYDAQGDRSLQMTTYHNNSDRWYLEMPDAWQGKITLSRQENSNAGERAVVFSYWLGDGNVPPEPFLTIYRFTGSDRETLAQRAGRFILWIDSETIYAAEWSESSWDCGLTQETLQSRFHLIRGDT